MNGLVVCRLSSLNPVILYKSLHATHSYVPVYFTPAIAASFQVILFLYPFKKRVSGTGRLPYQFVTNTADVDDSDTFIRLKIPAQTAYENIQAPSGKEIVVVPDVH